MMEGDKDEKRDEVASRIYEVLLPHVVLNLPKFLDVLLPTFENVTASPEATQQNNQAGPQDVDPLNIMPAMEEKEHEFQPQVPSEPIQFEKTTTTGQELSTRVPSHLEKPEQISPHKGGRRKKARVGRVETPSTAKNVEGHSKTSGAPESYPEASPTPLRKRTTPSSPPPP
ncbi:hypothetical protein V6N12_049249 [Hibiscus sabdariffa]|uniref:Uncharacterized protein n=1 Tax=Hibiscus sabdariffa TaxID=183260 RepID=A0ABR2ELZ6_9ROSI